MQGVVENLEENSQIRWAAQGCLNHAFIGGAKIGFAINHRLGIAQAGTNDHFYVDAFASKLALLDPEQVVTQVQGRGHDGKTDGFI